MIVAVKRTGQVILTHRMGHFFWKRGNSHIKTPMDSWGTPVYLRLNQIWL